MRGRAGIAFEHRHVFDASAALRNQLPSITDGDETIGDSDAVIAMWRASRGRVSMRI